mmetsp:Transcript_49382/g.147482  ORF Transcript_49382/g.147482 Transcript_49382/m.147482 type:complete len:934 (+) Transcript_49382:102-2903(+)
MQKLRRMNFFDREVVKKEGADIHPGVQKLSVSCACGGPDHLWFGDKAGELRHLDRQFVLSAPLQTFERELIDLKVTLEGQRLVALGCDAPAAGGVRYKVLEVRREEAPVLLHAHRVFPPRGPEHRATCLAVNAALTLLAVGTGAGAVYLFRGRNLAQEKPSPRIIAEEEGGQPVTSLHFLEEGHRTVLYACSSALVRSWVVIERDEPDLRLLNADSSGGAAECCSCVFPMIKALLVARGDAIFAYDPDEGNMSAMPLEGEKLILTQFKSYFVAVTAEGVPGTLGGSVTASPTSMPKQNVIVCLAYPHMRFIAYGSQFTDVTHVVTGMGGVFVVSRGGADSNTVLFELREKELSEQLDILVKKRMFEWAADIARLGDAPAETRAEIYRQHGDALFEKRAYDQALTVYTRTVDLKLPLEPSYVVEQFLGAQRIGHVAKYLKRLHEVNLAEREHTALLLKCYTKLKDFSTLGAFLETTPVSQYDPVTAIEVLEAAGYYGLAAEIAQRVERHEDYVRISLEHFKSYAKTLEFLWSLPKVQAGRILLEHGQVLMQHAPGDTIDLVREICGLRADGEPAEPAAREGRPRVDELLPIFVNDQPRLELFLRSVLLAPGGCQLPPAEAESLYPTLLELMVRSHHGLVLAERSSPDDEQSARRLHGEVMRLIRQYPGEGALASALMLCQTYGFVDGFFHAAERLGRFQLLMSWCFEQRDARRLLEVCKRCGSVDQSLWVQALSFLAADEGDHTEEIGEVLRHVEESSLMPLLMVLETLQKNPGITVGAVRPYLQGQFRKLAESVESNRGKGSESVDTSRAKAWQDRQEIARMQQEIVALRTQAQVFQNTKCSQCALTLEVPAVHFFCGHSYHSYCVPSDGGCPKCSSEALSRITLKEQREAQAQNTEDFFKELQGSSGEGGIQAIGEWCMFGAFDAGREDSGA